MGVDLQKVNPLYPSYIDLEVDIGRVTLSLPGPRDDAAYPSYELIIQGMNTKIGIQIKGDKNQSKRIPLTDESFKSPTASKFFLYGICYLGKVNRIHTLFDTIYLLVKRNFDLFR